MEQLALLSFVFWAFIIGCVGYSVIKAFLWFLSLFGGICLGC